MQLIVKGNSQYKNFKYKKFDKKIIINLKYL